MTAPQSARDGEVCKCGHERRWHVPGGRCLVRQLYGGPPADDCGHFRPAAPSEPPAADSPTPGTDDFRPVLGEPETPAYPYPTPGTETLPRCNLPICPEPGDHRITTGRCLLVPADPSPVDTTEPPAETQQDDERVTRGVARALWTQRLAHDPSVRERTAFLAGWDAALAARPSADTETLRDLLAQWSYERSPWFPALPWADASENVRGAFLRSAGRFLGSTVVRAALDAR